MHSRSLRAFDARLLVLLPIAACAAPPTASVGDAEIVSHVVERRSTLGDVELALQLADIAPLEIERPQVPSELKPDAAEFWHAAAFAWNPEVRRARHELLALRAARGSAGAPGPLVLDIDNRDFGGSQRETKVALTFDLLGVFGLGPASAARELADVEERRAVKNLEQAVWAARFEVDRARTKLSAARAKQLVLRALSDDAVEDVPRIDLLETRGWIAPSAAIWARAGLHRLDHAISEASSDEAAAERELAIAAGLPPDDPAIAQVGAASFERAHPDDVEWTEPTPRELLERAPELRAMRLSCAVAEARLRRVAAERWPNFRLGPQAVFVPGDLLPGAAASIDLPWPGSIDGRIEASLEECRAATDGLEDALLASLARVRERHTELEEAVKRLREHAPLLDEAGGRMWVAARAQFGVDPSALEQWTFALEHRAEPLVMMVEAREQFALALLAYDEARGPRDAESREVRP